MRVLILSDIHANPWALAAVERSAGRFDHVLCTGDTVNYGPAPGIVLAWLRERGAVSVRGNHDHAVAFQADPKASPTKQPLALAMRDWTRAQLGPADLAWLTRLPLSLQWEAGGVQFAMAHATPIDALYDYRLTPGCCNTVFDEVAGKIQADLLVLGHTHLPMNHIHGGLRIVNPGSVGQPLDGNPQAAYAVWEDGRVTLCRAEYELSSLLDAFDQLPLDSRMKHELAGILQQASLQ